MGGKWRGRSSFVFSYLSGREGGTGGEVSGWEMSCGGGRAFCTQYIRVGRFVGSWRVWLGKGGGGGEGRGEWGEGVDSL